MCAVATNFLSTLCVRSQRTLSCDSNGPYLPTFTPLHLPQQAADEERKLFDIYRRGLPLRGTVIACCADAEAIYLRHSPEGIIDEALHHVASALKAETDLLAQDTEAALIRVQSLQDPRASRGVAALEAEAVELNDMLLQRTTSRDCVHGEDDISAPWVPLQVDGQTGHRIKALPRTHIKHRSMMPDSSQDTAERAIDIAQLTRIVEHMTARLQGRDGIGEAPSHAFRSAHNTPHSAHSALLWI